MTSQYSAVVLIISPIAVECLLYCSNELLQTNTGSSTVMDLNGRAHTHFTVLILTGTTGISLSLAGYVFSTPLKLEVCELKT